MRSGASMGSMPPRPRYRLQPALLLTERHSAPPEALEALLCESPPPPLAGGAGASAALQDMVVDPDRPDEGWMVRGPGGAAVRRAHIALEDPYNCV